MLLSEVVRGSMIRNWLNQFPSVVIGLFLFGVLFASPALPQTISAGPPGNQISLDRLSNTVIFIVNTQTEVVDFQGQKCEVLLKPIGQPTSFPKQIQSVGTGFFVEDNNRLFLITANHIASFTSIRSRIVLKTNIDTPIEFPIASIVGSESLNWFHHPTADASAIQILPHKEVLPHLKEHFIPKVVLFPKFEAPSRDKPLTVLGFPLGLGLQGKFSPISKESKAASGLISFPRADTKVVNDFFLLDSPSIGGFSGAPVFILPKAYTVNSGLVFGNEFSCVGLVHGTLSDETGGKLCAVVPSQKIIECIESIK